MNKLVIVCLVILGLFASSSLDYQRRSASTTAALPIVLARADSVIYFVNDDLEKIYYVSVRVGDTFKINVMAYTNQSIYGHEIAISFDMSLLEYVGAETPRWALCSSQIGWLFWVAGQQGQTGDVPLMSFTFKSKAAGACNLTLYHHELATLNHVLYNTDVGWPVLHEAQTCTIYIS